MLFKVVLNGNKIKVSQGACQGMAKGESPHT